jgi:membrane protein
VKPDKPLSHAGKRRERRKRRTERLKPHTSLLGIGTQAVRAFIADDALTLAAALAFYTVLSFAPLIILSVWLTSSIGSDTQSAILRQIGALAGTDAQLAAAAIISNGTQLTLGSFTGIAAAVIAIVSATAAFAQLQFSLNTIWKIPEQPVNELRAWLLRRILAVGMLAATLATVAAALAANALLRMMLKRIGVPWFLFSQTFSLGVMTILFAVLFRYLPEVRLRWRDTFAGAFITSVLFMLGNIVIRQLLAHSNFGSAYGSMGSVVVFLVWIYYSATVFLFGAELIDVEYVARTHRGIH